MHFGQTTVPPEQRELNKVTSYMASYPPNMRPPSFSEYPNPVSSPKPVGEKSDGQGLPKIG